MKTSQRPGIGVGLEPRILHELVAHRLLIGLGGTGKKREGGKGRSGKLLE